MKEHWTKEQAWAWYGRYPWLRGCNFIGSDCANRRDQWQAYEAGQHMETADRELGLAEKTGFNTVRLIVDFDTWLQEEESFMDNLERYLSLADRHGQYVMLVLACEAELPRGRFEDFEPHPLGEQKYALGYHQGRFPLDPAYAALTPYHPLEVPELRDKYLRMVRDIVTKYAHDPRIIVWNVYNEPGITIGGRSMDCLRILFDTVRACDPDQPLTADVWRGMAGGAPKTEEEKLALELSDVISFHSYSWMPGIVDFIDQLKPYGMPLLCTEWLNRITHNDVADMYPMFYLERIGCWCWGFVVGKTQTNEPWDILWDKYERGEGGYLEFTKWQHDLFRPSFHPYDPHELEVIKSVNEMADRRSRTE